MKAAARSGGGWKRPSRLPGTTICSRWRRAITDKTRLLFVCNPNNPDWHHGHQNRSGGIDTAVPGVVVVVFDEAYYEYVRHPSTSRLDRICGKAGHAMPRCVDLPRSVWAGRPADRLTVSRRRDEFTPPESESVRPLQRQTVWRNVRRWQHWMMSSPRGRFGVDRPNHAEMGSRTGSGPQRLGLEASAERNEFSHSR